MLKGQHSFDDGLLGFIMRGKQEHSQLNALVQHTHCAPLVAGDQHLALQLDGATRKVWHIFGHGLGQLGFKHAGAIQND